MATTEKERVKMSLSEVWMLVLGAQILLGFQFASYLTSAFEKLSSAAKVVNTASLFMLVLAMVLLMTPAPDHRLVEGGENTEHFEHVTERLALAALAPLALGVARDVFVVADVVLGGLAASVAALACVAGMAALWFGMPLVAVRPNPV